MSSVRSLSADRIRDRIKSIVEAHATDEAKQQDEGEKKWRQENVVNNRQLAPKERRKVKDQIPILSRLRTEGLEQLWELVKENREERYQNEHCRRSNSPCWIWQTRKRTPFTEKQGYGYINLVGLGKTALMVTHLALWTRCHSLRPTRRDHVSHLCHTPECFNPDHLCSEHRLMNAGRNGCLAFRDDQCLVSDCIHIPPCIVAYTTNLKRVKDKSTKASTGIADNSIDSFFKPRKKQRVSNESETDEEEAEDDDHETVELPSD
jgi:hypothetical protein